jgi:hypothetical protein
MVGRDEETLRDRATAKALEMVSGGNNVGCLSLVVECRIGIVFSISRRPPLAAVAGDGRLAAQAS